MTDLEDVTLVTQPSRKILNQKQLADYRATRKKCLSWLLTFGKKPDQAEGYASTTVSARASRMDMFYRWVWGEYDGYTTNVTHKHADAWMRELARQDKSNAHKANCQKAAKMLFKWRRHEHGLDEWVPEVTFSDGNGATQPRDYLTLEERRKIREAALEYGSVPRYDSLSPDARDRWRRYLAQSLEKSMADITPDDWERANDWKITSLAWTSLDAGLRPVEVERATIDWVDVGNSVLRIPKEESSKNRENWVVSIREKTADALERWIRQRSAYDKYEGTDAIWLTRKGNRYGSSSLKYTLERLCEIAGISTGGRKMSWYSIRHSVGTYMTREEDLAAAQTQLRHKSRKTTMKYDQVPIEDRRDALERI
mgnify:CR=1 FL=1